MQVLISFSLIPGNIVDQRDKFTMKDMGHMYIFSGIGKLVIVYHIIM